MNWGLPFSPASAAELDSFAEYVSKKIRALQQAGEDPGDLPGIYERTVAARHELYPSPDRFERKEPI